MMQWNLLDKGKRALCPGLKSGILSNIPLPPVPTCSARSPRPLQTEFLSFPKPHPAPISFVMIVFAWMYRSSEHMGCSPSVHRLLPCRQAEPPICSWCTSIESPSAISSCRDLLASCSITHRRPRMQATYVVWNPNDGSLREVPLTCSGVS